MDNLIRPNQIKPKELHAFHWCGDVHELCTFITTHKGVRPSVRMVSAACVEVTIPSDPRPYAVFKYYYVLITREGDVEVLPSSTVLKLYKILG